MREAFDSFDIDHSDAIDLEECLRHWGQKGFGRISAQEFLKTVDMDGNGEIEFDEFLRFWQVVKDAGHSEESMIEELIRIKNGESWVGFQNLPICYRAKPSEKMIKRDTGSSVASVDHVKGIYLLNNNGTQQEFRDSEAAMKAYMQTIMPAEEEEQANVHVVGFQIGQPQQKKAGEGLDNLSPECEDMVHQAFDSFDIDHSDAIDMEECLRHWGQKGFGRISAKEFLRTVDMDGNGEIEFDEFLRFWKVVKDCGHTEAEIMEELERIKNGESWVGFQNLPKEY